LFSQLKRDGVRDRPVRALDVNRLSAPEREVADLLIRGQSNWEIAAGLQIAIDTVKHRVHGVLSKLEARSRLEVAALSQRAAPGDDPGISAAPIPMAFPEALPLIPSN
jgi:DNA-binding NarL/FixJ family response regulator